MSDISKLMSGFRIFKATTFQQKKDVIEHLLMQGQKPSTMVISCSDLRISPSELFAANPGELFVLTNIGGIVPRYETTGIHGILAAIEYAVTVIEVENIIVLGHAQCDSVKLMMSEQFSSNNNEISDSMKNWLSVAGEAREAVKKQMADKTAIEQQAACERESIIVSLRNLISYPYIKKRMAENKLNIFGWHFNVESGEIMAFDPDTKFFEPIS